MAAFVGGSLVLSAVGWWLHPVAGWVLLVLGALLSAWCVWFFRDPERALPTEPGAIVSPADGVVCAVDHNPPPAELGLSPEQVAGMTRVSIFMNVFNVHVNRSPMAGTVTAVNYRPGAFFNASFDKASELNERYSLAMRTPGGRTFAVVQIAGLIARRIVCKVQPGRTLGAGERFGLIRFGSRVDCYLPAGATARVKLGEKTTAGATIIGILKEGAA